MTDPAVYCIDRLSRILPQRNTKDIRIAFEEVFNGSKTARDDFIDLLTKHADNPTFTKLDKALSWTKSLEFQLKILYILMKLQC